MNRASASLSILVFFPSCVGISVLAQAVDAYPSRPVRWIVTYPPGGGSDLAARLIAPKVALAVGQPIVIDNRGGAAGVIGTQLAAKAAPDGYTFLFAVSTIIVAPLLSRLAPYDPVKDFTPVSLAAVNPFLLVINSAVPAASVKELIAFATAKPRALNYGSSGSGGANHLSMELFKSMTGTEIVHVPYKGSGPAITELLGGQVQVMMNNVPPFMPHVQSGKLRALAVTGAQRSPALPDVPTVMESGVPGYEYVSWYALFAPARTPAAIVDKVGSHLRKILAEPELAHTFLTHGFEARGSTSRELAAFMQEDTERLKKVVRAVRITAD